MNNAKRKAERSVKEFKEKEQVSCLHLLIFSFFTASVLVSVCLCTSIASLKFELYYHSFVDILKMNFWTITVIFRQVQHLGMNSAES